MPMKYLSLGELGFSDTPLEAQHVTVRTGPGEQDFVNVLLGDFRTFVNESVNQRIDDLEAQIGGATGPSIWPAAKTLTLTGAVTGSVAFDGSADFSLVTVIADGSLTVAKTNGLQGLIEGKLDSTANAVSASKLATARSISLTGLITGSTSFDGSGNVTLATVMADGALSVAKISGLQGLLDGKMSAGTGGLGGSAVNGGSTWNTINATGFYRMGGTTDDGAPFNGADHDVIHLQASNGDASQISLTSPVSVSFRVKDDAATWSPWQTFYHTGNLDPGALQYLPLSSTLYNAGSGLDCNNLSAGTKVWAASSLANTPGTASTYWYIETLLYGNGTSGLLQRAYGTSADETWFRTHNGTSWGTWRRIWNASNFVPSSKLDTNANAASATKLFTARTISLTGATTGSTSFDGSGNVSIATTLASGAALANLGYTPVHQGTGIGQLSNTVHIGWKTGSLLGVTVDSTDIGNVAFQSWVGANFLSLGNAAGKANVSGQVFTGAIEATNFASKSIANTDFNSIITSGFYRFEAANANKPSGMSYGQLLVIHGASDTIAQIASDYSSTNLAWRSGNPPDVGGTGAWGVWRNLWHDGNFTPSNKMDSWSPIQAGGYWTVRPYGVPYDDGSYVQAYYDGNNRLFKLFGRDSSDIGFLVNIQAGNLAVAAITASSVSANSVTIGGNAVWHAGNFNPADKANLAGAAFTNTVSVPYLIAGDGNGTASIRVGNDTNLWDVNVANTFGVRGIQDATKGLIRFGSDANGFGWDGTKLAYGASTVWHSGNFDPTVYALKDNPTLTGIVTLSSGGETRYLLSSSGQRTVGLISTQTPRVGLYDYTNSKWMLRFESDNKAYLDNGGLTVNCVSTSDVFAVNNPGSSPAGSNVTITSPGGSPGIIGQYGTTKRRDIQFTDSGIQLAVSSTTAGSAIQFTFGENGNFLASGTISAASFGGAGVSQEPSGSTIVQRTSAGYIKCNYINTTANDIGAGSPSHISVMTASDGYHRWQTPANFINVNNILTSTGVVSGVRLFAGWDSGTANSVSCSGWFRTTGNTGLYCSDYGGGVYMTDATYLRSYNNKAIVASDFVISSDKRLKKAVRPFEYRGRLRPVHFEWRETGETDFGFIAQEVEKLYPESIGRLKKDGGLLDGKEILQLSQQKLTAVLSSQVNHVEDNVIQLKNQTEKLKNENRLLKQRLSRLEKMVAKLAA